MIKETLLSFLFIVEVFGDVGTEFIEKGRGPNELPTLEYLSLVKPFLPLDPNVLEAGAHSGEDTLLLANAWPKGHVFAFEPVKNFFQLILNNLNANSIKNVSAFPIGLFSHRETASFTTAKIAAVPLLFCPTTNCRASSTVISK